MFQYRSRWLIIVAALVILVMSLWLHSPLSAPVTYACSGNCETITNTPKVIVTLNGADQTVNYALTFNLNNAGTNGWHISIGSTQFTTGGAPAYTLPLRASSVIGVTSACQTGQTCTTDPQNVITYPVGVPITPDAVTFYDARSHSGIGTFDVTADLALIVPANTHKGIYTSTVTLAQTDGP